MATTVDTYVTALGKSTILKDPQAKLDYSFEWAPWLTNVADTIASVEHEVTVEAGDLTPVVASDSSFQGTKTVVWLSGGTVGKTYRVTSRITTTNSIARIDDRSIFVKVVQR